MRRRAKRPNKRPKLTVEQAAERAVDALDRHLSRLPAKERALKLAKFYKRTPSK